MKTSAQGFGNSVFDRTRSWVCISLILMFSIFLAACSPEETVRTSYRGAVPPEAVARLGKGALDTVALSPNGESVAAGGEVGLYLYRIQDLEAAWSIPTDASVVSTAFSSDGVLIAAGLADGRLLLAESESGEVLDVLARDGSGSEISFLAWAASPPDRAGEDVLAIGYNDGTVLLSEVAQSNVGMQVETIGQFTRDQNGVTAMAFSPDRRFLAAGNRVGAVNLLDLQTSTWVGSLVGHEFAHAVLDVHWSPDGSHLVSGGRDRQVIVWDVASQAAQHILHAAEGEILGVVYSAAGERVVAASDAGILVIWDAESGHTMDTLPDLATSFTTLDLSSGSSRLATVSGDGRLMVWNFSEGFSRRSASTALVGHTPLGWWTTAVAWSPDGARLASGSDSRVMIWNTATRELERILSGHERLVSDLEWSPDGDRLASGSQDATIVIWDAQTGERVRTLSGHDDAVGGLAWSPDGGQIASAGSLDDSVIVWDVTTGEPAYRLRGAGDGMWSVAWSPDGATLATGTTSGQILLWDVAGANLEAPEGLLRAHLAWVGGLAWSPDGGRLASASADGRVIVWDVTTGDVLQALAGHDHVVRGVAFSPDGNQLASGARDHLVILWDAREGTDSIAQLETLVGHSRSVDAVAWSPDGTRLASASEDGTVILWEVEQEAGQE